MSDRDRRTFLKELAIASAAIAGASVVHPATSAAAAGAPARGARALAWKKTPCTLCGIGCGLLVGVENGRAVAVKGDPESPVSRGLACVKGYHAVQTLYGSDRITRAMIRRNGSLVPASTSEALDLVAERMRDAVARHGRDAVAVFGSTRWSALDAQVASALFIGAVGSANADTAARLYSASATSALASTFGLEGAAGTYEDVDYADTFIVWDGNIAETDPVLFSRMLERRQKNPAARIIVLSTRATRTGWAADAMLLHRPHAELSIANAIAHEIVARKRVDREFLDRYVSFARGNKSPGHGLADEPLLGETVERASWDEYVKHLEPYAPDAVRRTAGLTADNIQWLASQYFDPSRKVMSIWGAGVNQHSRGQWANELIHNIHLLVGKIASPGNAAFGLTGQPGGTLPALVGPKGRPTQDALSIFRAIDRGDVRFLWIQGANPLAELPNVRRYRRALEKPDRFVVVSDAYPTATTAIADVVLPAALWIEREGVFVSAERRVSHVEQLVEPPGEAASDARHLAEVARRLGHTQQVPASADAIWNEWRRAHGRGRQEWPALSELREGRSALWPVANGRETKWRYNTAHDPAADRAHGEFDFYGHADHRARIWLRSHQPLAETPDGQFPFWLETGPVLEHSASATLTRRIPTLQRAVPRAYVEINRADATKLGIRDRERVRLVTRRGALELEARIDHRSQPATGVVFVPSFDELVPVNVLTLDARCPSSGQPQYGRCAVRVERLPRGGVA